jgi:hypothetical protein
MVRVEVTLSDVFLRVALAYGLRTVHSDIHLASDHDRW